MNQNTSYAHSSQVSSKPQKEAPVGTISFKDSYNHRVEYPVMQYRPTRSAPRDSRARIGA